MSKLNALVDLNNSDETSSLMTQALLLKPRHLVASPFLRQLPFLFWLLEAARPRTIVQLGMGDGLVYMGLCQAVDRFFSGAGCIGISFENAPLPTELKQTHDAEYAELSILRDHGQTAAGLPDMTNIDFLIVHGDPANEHIKDLITEWAPHLSNKAIVVICYPEAAAKLDASTHAIPRAPITGPTTQDNSLFEAYLYGEDQPERLQRLAAKDWNDADRITARQVFNRLGDTVMNSFECGALKQQCDKAATALEGATQTNAQLRTANAEMHAEIAKLKRHCETVETAAAADRIRMDRKIATSEAQSKTPSAPETSGGSSAAAKPAAKADRTEIADLKKKLERATVSAAEQKAKLTEARAQTQIDSKLIADLKRELKKLGGVLKDQKAAKAALTLQHEKTLDGIYQSSSWRATRPLRGLKKLTKQP